MDSSDGDGFNGGAFDGNQDVPDGLGPRPAASHPFGGSSSTNPAHAFAGNAWPDMDAYMATSTRARRCTQCRPLPPFQSHLRRQASGPASRRLARSLHQEEVQGRAHTSTEEVQVQRRTVRSRDEVQAVVPGARGAGVRGHRLCLLRLLRLRGTPQMKRKPMRKVSSSPRSAPAPLAPTLGKEPAVQAPQPAAQAKGPKFQQLGQRTAS